MKTRRAACPWRRALPVEHPGNAHNALGGAFGAYCWTFGLPQSDELRHRTLTGLLWRKVDTWSDWDEGKQPYGLTDDDRWSCVHALNEIVRDVDGDFGRWLRQHNKRLGTFVKLRNQACGMLLNQDGPYPPNGDPAVFEVLGYALQEHMDGCDGEHCSLLEAGVLLLERQAA